MLTQLSLNCTPTGDVRIKTCTELFSNAPPPPWSAEKRRYPTALVQAGGGWSQLQTPIVAL